jgi:teichuronic acid biosynthesis glycosyltransferase TuaG
MLPLVSVIVTTYNRKELLNATINSILDQSFTQLEIIVVDNFSDYDFIGFLDSFNDKRISGYQNANNGVIAVNRNFGIRHSTGKYLAFCDDDDIWLPDKLQKQIEMINQYPENQKLLIHTNCECFGPGIKSFNTRKKDISTINDFLFENYVTLSSTLMTRSALTYFEELPELRAVEDFFLWLNLILNDYKIILIENALVRYYVNNNSVSRGHQELRHLKFLQCLLMIMLRYPDNKIKSVKFGCSSIIQLLKYSIKRNISKWKQR